MKKALAVTFALSLFAAVAMANEGHGGGPGPGGPEGGFIVGSDGTVYLTTTTVSSGVATTTVKAVRSTGVVAWTATINGRGGLELSDGNLLSVTEVRAADGTVTSTITAISTATGTTAWTRAIGGRIAELQPFSGGTYAIAVVPSTTTGGTATRSLVAISNSGAILWTLAL
jgi:hypothetical protein